LQNSIIFIIAQTHTYNSGVMQQESTQNATPTFIFDQNDIFTQRSKCMQTLPDVLHQHSLTWPRHIRDLLLRHYDKLAYRKNENVCYTLLDAVLFVKLLYTWGMIDVDRDHAEEFVNHGYQHQAVEPIIQPVFQTTEFARPVIFDSRSDLQRVLDWQAQVLRHYDPDMPYNVDPQHEIPEIELDFANSIENTNMLIIPDMDAGIPDAFEYILDDSYFNHDYGSAEHVSPPLSPQLSSLRRRLLSRVGYN
jgi:hypothetical protein